MARVYVLFYLTTTLQLIVSAKCVGEPFYAAISGALMSTALLSISPVSLFELMILSYFEGFLLALCLAYSAIIIDDEFSV